MFGTKKIYCKIINGKLVVRVGGGYMGMEEFISVYGQQEVNKYAHAHGIEVTAQWTEGGETLKSGTASKKKATGSGQGSETPKDTSHNETTSGTSTFRKAVKK